MIRRALHMARLTLAMLYCFATMAVGFAHAAPVTPDQDPSNFVLPGTSLADFCDPSGDDAEAWAEHCAACQLAKALAAAARHEALSPSDRATGADWRLAAQAVPLTLHARQPPPRGPPAIL